MSGAARQAGGRALALGAVLLAGCATGTAPFAPTGPDGQPDPALELGRGIYAQQCARCHGADGRGGAGPRLAGRMESAFPDPAEQAEVVREGRRGMPAFPRLSDDELDAVVRYTREVLRG
jgi:mono/diheme cytochrome c family protein